MPFTQATILYWYLKSNSQATIPPTPVKVLRMNCAPLWESKELSNVTDYQVASVEDRVVHSDAIVVEDSHLPLLRLANIVVRISIVHFLVVVQHEGLEGRILLLAIHREKRVGTP